MEALIRDVDLSDTRDVSAAEPFPALVGQKEVWLAQKLRPNTSFNLSLYAIVVGRLDVSALSRATERLVEVTPCLRSRFSSVGGVPHVSITELGANNLLYFDTSHSPKGEDEALAIIYEDTASAKDALESELWKHILIKVGPKKWFWYQRYHHIVADGRTVAILTRRLWQLYVDLIGGADERRADLGEFLPVYDREKLYPGSSRAKLDEQFWREEIHRPFDHGWLSRPISDRHKDAVLQVKKHVNVSETHTALCAACGVRRLELWAAVIALHFHFLTRRSDLQFSLPVANASKHTITIPWMTSTVLPLRLHWEKDATIMDCITECGRTIRRLVRHQQFRGESVRRMSREAQQGWFGPSINLMDFENIIDVAGCSFQWEVSSLGVCDDFTVAILNVNDGRGDQIVLRDVATAHSDDDLRAHANLISSLFSTVGEHPEISVSELASALENEYSNALHGTFYHNRRKGCAGILRWTESSERLQRLARSLQFSDGFRCGVPKIIVRSGIIGCCSIESSSAKSKRAPGTVVQDKGTSWTVATSTGDISLEQVVDVGFGARLGDWIDHSHKLPIVQDSKQRDLVAKYEEADRWSSFWAERFAGMYFPRIFGEGLSRADQCGGRVSSEWISGETLRGFKGHERAELVVALLLIYLRRISGEDYFHVLIGVGTSGRQQEICLPLLPLAVEIGLSDPVKDVFRIVGRELELIGSRPCVCDLSHRYRTAREAIERERQQRITIRLVENKSVAIGTCQSRLALEVCRRDGSFRVTCEAQLGLGVAAHLTAMIRSVSQLGLDRPSDQIEILPDDERELLLKTWNATETDYPKDLCIHQLFEEQVEKSPEAAAVIYEERSLSYEELNEEANRLAHHLIGLGVKPDDRVAICVDRSLEMVIGLLAILKAGAAYVPLDPVYPSARLLQIVSDAAPSIILLDSVGHEALGDGPLQGKKVLNLESLRDGGPIWADASCANPDPKRLGLSSSNLAYVIYTSGSTGQPKGVMIEHRSVVNFSCALNKLAYQNCQSPQLRIGWNASFSFDMSIKGFSQLLFGHCLIIVPQHVRAGDEDFVAYIGQHHIDSFDTTPSQLELLISRGLLEQKSGNSRTILLGGEAISSRLWDQIRNKDCFKIYNMYGPTECTVDGTMGFVGEGKEGPNIGRPIWNTQIYILDDHRSPVPLGAIGEIYIAGDGVARGYLNRPDLTAERFLKDPFSDSPDARMYKTGDLGRYLPDGNLEFLGRNDHQVKIRGFRIELGEIEACLVEHPLVREAVVAAREDETGDKRLVAYVVPVDAGQGTEAVTALRSYLAEQLPDYMVPSAFVQLASLPLTPNGKLDRKALPAPEGDAYARRPYEAPQGEVEEKLAAIWQELLGIERISRHDNFFELGGHSLMAVRLLMRVQNVFQVELRLMNLFSQPKLIEVASTIENSNSIDDSNNLPIAKISREGLLPLSFAQRRMWIIDKLSKGSVSYHIPAAVRFIGDLDLPIFRRSLNAIIFRHESLRTIFVARDGEPHAKLLPADHGFDLYEYDLRGKIDRYEQSGEIGSLEAKTPFDLSKGPLIRGKIVRLEDQEYIFFLNQHHIVSDGWSNGILIRELGSLYGALSRGEPNPLPNLPIQYPDYAAWQITWLSGKRLASQAAYWKECLTGAPALLDVPADRARPEQQDYTGAHVSIDINPKLTRALKRLSQQHRVTLFMVLLAAWSAVLSRLSGQRDLVIGTPSANRRRQETEGLIGLFINTVALRVDLAGEPSVEQLLSRVCSAILAAQDNQDLPFEQVVDIIQPPRSLSYTPIYQVLFAWQNFEWQNQEILPDVPNLEAKRAQIVYERARFDLYLTLHEHGDRIVGELTYATSLFDEATICRHVSYLIAMLEEMAADSSQKIDQIEILPDDERELLLKTWNATETDYPKDLCIHQLFEEQVEKSPEAAAVIYEERSLSYEELNEEANRLAHHLIGLGVKPDDRVAICVDRSLEMVIGLLAILKAGAAYVPLDPVYPSARLLQIVSDAAPSIILLDSVGHEALGDGPLQGKKVLNLESLRDGGPIWADASCANPDPKRLGLSSSNLAYVIYTSGSTGQPKGVMIEHRSVVNFSCALNKLAYQNCQSPQLRIGWNASFSFDMSIKGFSQLLFGHCLIIVPQHVRAGDEDFVAYIGQHHIDSFDTTPSQLELLISRGLLEQKSGNSRTILLGGEAISSRLWDQIRNKDCFKIYNMYGPTECTVDGTMGFVGEGKEGPNIGRPIWNTQIYILDDHRSPVPLGAIGEIYIAGDGVARGYLNRPDLTAERFLKDPFSDSPDARMYKTGDLGRYLPDGNLEFLGRNDHQVKIRGFRIELGEIEACLVEHPLVREAVVAAREDETGDKRLVAYVVPVDAGQGTEAVTALRSYLAEQLPDYMVPSAFVQLASLPLTPNGKLDRKALPAPEGDAYARRPYEAPQGEVEEKLAAIWQELLGIERISRHDNFFELGGHSLMAVSLIVRLRRVGLHVEIRTLFTQPVLKDLAAIAKDYCEVPIPVNVITADSRVITPQMLPLIDLEQEDIDRIIEQTPGGIGNIQDIYALSPLQDGILFHHLMANEGDPYLVVSQLGFADRRTLDKFLSAVQQVVDRHDILRTAFVWEGLSSPAQVVWRRAQLPVTEVELDPEAGPATEQLSRRFDPRRYRIDLTKAPLLSVVTAYDTQEDRWIAMLRQHHLVGDHSTLDVLRSEVQVLLSGSGDNLVAPSSFRNFIAQVRSGPTREEHERFFRTMLSDITEPTLPFGLADVHQDGSQIEEKYRALPQILSDRLRSHARRLGVSLASLCHLAWGQVLARSSGLEQVVFGTVLFGRMQGGEGADQGTGLYINTLPLRLDLDETPVEHAVKKAHSSLAELLLHEHASLSSAQRCSGVAPATPLFSAILNYRRGRSDVSHNKVMLEGINSQRNMGFTNYPLVLSIEDNEEAFRLITQSVQLLSADRVCGYMHRALESLVEALDKSPNRPVRELEILPDDERELLLKTWNATETDYPKDLCIHQLFEEQVEKSPEAAAVICEERSLSYEELNEEANRLAHHLIGLGVKPDDRVAICVDRSLEMVIGLLAILKAGAAYVPLDPVYPSARLLQIVSDAAPSIILLDSVGHEALGDGPLQGKKVLNLESLRDGGPIWADASCANPDPKRLGLSSSNLAYVIYTSGSTGQPKGVMIEHRSVVNYLIWARRYYSPDGLREAIVSSPIAFDATVTSLYTPLVIGGTARLLPSGEEIARVKELLCQRPMDLIKVTPAHLSVLAHELSNDGLKCTVRTAVVGGEILSAATVKAWQKINTGIWQVINEYGATEATVGSVIFGLEEESKIGIEIPVGRSISNMRTYILDDHRSPVPLGAIGEIYIAGDGVARGYLNRADLTAERFLKDPFSDSPDARMYKTGDLGRYLPDGNLEFLGRNDHQVKIRGFRIELGEIEACLVEHPLVREAVVAAREDETGDKRLVAYVVPVDAGQGTEAVTALHSYLAEQLPDYMVPSAFVQLTSLPLTPNGKLDRKALPAPEGDAYAWRPYEAPQGEVEEKLAAIWQELLGIERISRHDNFFELGGHSLLAVSLMERLRRVGLHIEIRAIFTQPVLKDLAAIAKDYCEVPIPANVITADSRVITPQMLPLIDLEQEDIDRIIEQTPGGIGNIQDIYALSPLQDGILFHHLMASEGDPYLQLTQLSFVDRRTLDKFLSAVQQVVDRHDILRTAFVWEGLSSPAQVVWRRAQLPVTEVELDPEAGPATEQLSRRFDPRRYRIDLTKAPLWNVVTTYDTQEDRWIAMLRQHHLLDDHSTLDVLRSEIFALLGEGGDGLSVPSSFRNFIAQVRSGPTREEHERFFRTMLSDITEPTLPFGLADVHQDGSQIEEKRKLLPQILSDRLRSHARRLGVSLASLCHLAWGQVLARSSGLEQVVFGTVLFGRMQGGEGADQGTGLYINTLPLRLDLDETPVEHAVKKAHSSLAELLLHEHASLASAQRCSGVAPATPLFSAILNYRHNMTAPNIARENASHLGIMAIRSVERNNYPLTLSVEDYGQAMGMRVAVIQPLSADRVCGYMHRALESLVEALDKSPNRPVRELEILPDDERELLLKTWNATETDYPKDLCIHQLFEEQVEKSPEAAAVIYEERSLSYEELNEEANRLAHHLIGLGVKPDDRVAICVDRSLEMVIGLLAILKAGAAYVPLDPVYPSARLLQIVSDAAPSIILLDSVGHEALGDGPLQGKKVLNLESLRDGGPIWADASCANPDPKRLGLSSSNLAYVIYTSGSTGQPKGVMIEHRSVVNHTLWFNSQYDLSCGTDTVLQRTSLSFDASVWEIFSPLSSGIRVRILPNESRLEFQTHDQQSGITVLQCTPSLLNELAKAETVFDNSLKHLFVGGEKFTIKLATSAIKRFPNAHLHNLFGPTEATIDAAFWDSYSEPSAGTLDVPIGRPIWNTQIYILDDHRSPVPLGAIGEIYIAGDGVARGYLNRPDLTAERFLKDPFSDSPDARMYKTGDLGRYLPDGNLEFLGRNDHQVKIRGFRIELGEIEACLVEHPLVREAVVAAREDETGDKRLVAYVVPVDAGQGTEAVTALRSYLAEQLPDYMVPSAFVQLASLPLTPNGKLDRKALPAPEGDAYARRPYEAPQGEVEEKLAAIWQELLGIERISRHDNFFERGGHSLLAISLIVRLRRVGLHVEIRTLFTQPVLKDLAAIAKDYCEVPIPVNVITADSRVITPQMLPLIDLEQEDIDRIIEQTPGGIGNIQDIYALSPLQDGILFHHLMASEGDPYLFVSQLGFADRRTLDKFLSAAQQVVDRHDILRTAFVWEGLSSPAQVVWRRAQLPVMEVELDPEAGPATEQLSRRFDPRRYRIDLTKAPLLSVVTAYDTQEDRWIAMLRQHHLVGDHSTLDVLRSEVQVLLSGSGDNLVAPSSFRNFIAQVRSGPTREEHERFFRTMLSDITEPTLPFGLADIHQDGSQIEEKRKLLPQILSDRLRSHARRLGVSLASLCHLAWGQVLARSSGLEQVVFGTVLFGRMQGGEGADQGTGLYINTLPLRLDLDETPVEHAVKKAHSSLAELLLHEHASLASAQRCSGVAPATPLFSAILNYRHSLAPNIARENTSHLGIMAIRSVERTNYPLTLSVEDYGQAMGVTVQSVQLLSADRVCGYMHRALESLVEALDKSPNRPVRELEILPDDERELLLKTWNATETDYPKDLCIHQLFEEQVEKSPEAAAVIYEERSLSYEELNEEANRLAHHLIGLGVKPDDRVAICVDRSLEMVIGLLAILKAGAAYVPLDPVYPSARLLQIVSDAAPSIILLDSVGHEALGDGPLQGKKVLNLKSLRDGGPIWADASCANPDPKRLGLSSSNLAYVIYTSGSTGQPKGVMIEHRSVVNHTLWFNSQYDLSCGTDTVLQRTSLSFDASVWEIFSPLSSGIRVRILPNESRLEFQTHDQQSGITVLQCTPSLLNELAKAETVFDNSLKHLFVGGEKFTIKLATSAIKRFPNAHLHNLFGPTEATIDAAFWDSYSEPSAGTLDVPIGRPIWNTQIYILDDHRSPVPLGAIGEIYIAGDGVARGYLNRPDLTAERFLKDPFSDSPDARMYKTGDLGRYLPDGNLEFLGRNDHQVKIRGFRIELGEIEACLVEHPLVREAVVAAREDETGDKRLVAYVVPVDAGQGTEAVTALRSYLAEQLPDYMVPSAFVQLASLPLTPNGKLDRKALPAPEGDAYARRPYEAPQGEVEEKLAAIWQELLGIERISRHDNFFELGAHSLLAVSLMERLRRVGLHIEIRAIFTQPVLKDLAAIAKDYCEVPIPANVITADSRVITPQMLPLIDLEQEDIDRIIEQTPGGIGNIQDIYALSPLQDGILFHHLMASEGDPYLLINQLGFADRRTLDKFLSAVQQVVDRHDILRTAFVWESLSSPAQVVWRRAQLPVTEVELDPEAGPATEQLSRRFDPRRYRIDLTKAPLLSVVTAYDTQEDRWIAMLRQHHLVGDNVTFAMLRSDVHALLDGR